MRRIVRTLFIISIIIGIFFSYNFLKNRNLNFYLRFMHYSNAGIKEPNDGLNSTMVGFSYRF